jgi:hypothetical protein
MIEATARSRTGRMLKITSRTPQSPCRSVMSCLLLSAKYRLIDPEAADHRDRLLRKNWEPRNLTGSDELVGGSRHQLFRGGDPGWRMEALKIAALGLWTTALSSMIQDVPPAALEVTGQLDQLLECCVALITSLSNLYHHSCLACHVDRSSCRPWRTVTHKTSASC